MAWSFPGGGTATSTGTTATTAVGVTVAVDDIVLMVAATNQQDTSNSFSSFAASAGSTATLSARSNLVNGIGASSGETSLTVAWARVTGAGTLDITATFTNSRTRCIAFDVLRGADTGATPFGTPVSASGLAGKPASGTVTPGGAGYLFIGAGAWEEVSGGLSSISPTASPSAWTQRQTLRSSTGTTGERVFLETFESVDATAYQSAPTFTQNTDWAQMVVVLAPATSGAYTLTAANGTYADAGQDAAILLHRSTVASQGTFTMAGQSVGIGVGRVLVAGTGAYTLTGQSATLSASSARTLAASPGTFALTGQSASLTAARKVVAAQATFTLTGQTATLLRGRALAASPGTFTTTGQAASLRAARALSALHTTYTLTGQAATLTYSGAAAPYMGMVRLTAARGPAFAFYPGVGPAVRLTPREPSP